MNLPKRKSARLKGYDYSSPGNYFVTICASDRQSIFGDIIDGQMRLSDIGELVENCWRAIPEHFSNVKVAVHQVMPNHLHGIVEIGEKAIRNTCTDVACNVRTGYSSISPKPGDLGTIIRSFKSAATAQVHEKGLTQQKTIWHSRFYDHIIRDDRDRFFIELYIELNPLVWYLESDNPEVRSLSPDALRKILREKHGIDGYLLERIIQLEIGYRE